MEKMPYEPQLDVELRPAATSQPAARATDWRAGLPALTGWFVTLRELRAADAPALFAALTSNQVARFISPPPSSIEGFERFISWTIRQRQAGQYLCFAIVPRGSDVPIGIFQVRSLEPAFGTAEWGFAMASEFWGTGMFIDAAQLVVDFVFERLGTYRLEARAALRNGRGNAALRKLGAVQESVLHRSFKHGSEYLDQALWTILIDQWREAKTMWRPRVIH